LSKCLKCGAALPPVGECPTCAAASQPAAPGVPSLLNKDIQIDRRSRTPESTPVVSGAAVPSFADLERGPAAGPPGMMPARQAPPPPPAMPQRSQTPPMMPQAHVAPPPPPMPAPQRLPAPAPMPAAQVAAAVPPAMRPVQPSQTPAPMPAAQVAATPPSMPPPQRLPIPSPMAAPQASPPPHTAPRAPSGVAVPTSSPQALQGDPDQTLPDTLPGTPVPRTASAPAHVAPEVPAPAAAALVNLDDPDTTAPGNPSLAARPPSDAPAPATGSLPVPRPMPAPAEVVTFAGPSRLPTPPRMPEPSAAPASAREGATAGNAEGVQEIHARPASLWRRLLSFTIDTTALVGVATLYIFLASSIAGVKAPSSQGLTPLDSIAAWMHAAKSVLLPGIILLLVLATVYCAVAAFLWNGRTLGRLLLGLRLVDTHGLAPAPSRAIVRALLSVVSFGLFLGGFWMALFDRRGQTLHDKLTSTFVVQPS
jgi:resuscitation-promoting factor RpfA